MESFGAHDIHPPAEKPFELKLKRCMVRQRCTTSPIHKEVHIALARGILSADGSEYPNVRRPMVSSKPQDFLSAGLNRLLNAAPSP